MRAMLFVSYVCCLICSVDGVLSFVIFRLLMLSVDVKCFGNELIVLGSVRVFACLYQVTCDLCLVRGPGCRRPVFVCLRCGRS